VPTALVHQVVTVATLATTWLTVNVNVIAVHMVMVALNVQNTDALNAKEKAAVNIRNITGMQQNKCVRIPKMYLVKDALKVKVRNARNAQPLPVVMVIKNILM